MPKSISFFEYQDSALDAGEYTIQLDQALTVINKHGTGTLSEKLVRTLVVQGKRFALDPSDIASVYPGPGSDGDYTAVLPHLILNLNTLPWQRSPDGTVRNSSPNYPWLALLVFTESDGIPVPKKITLGDLWASRGAQASWIEADSTLDAFLEYGEKADDPVTVIDVDRTALSGILPAPAELALLAHVRGEFEGTDASKATALQTALVANRLPKSGERHSVHLVSLMHCLQPITAANQGQVLLRAGSSADFRLVSLHNWTFYCEDTSGFKQRLKSMNKDLFRLPSPSNTGDALKKYFQEGFTILPHHLRIGRDAASLYRGPLSAGVPAAPALPLPVESADHLLLYDRQSGLLDVSYAAAWTLGRQLALEDQKFALDLYKYKRRLAIKQRREAAQAGISHLPVGKKDFSDDDQELTVELRKKILDWLAPFQTLQNIPFHYLVPREQLLPVESIRFFRIDPFWIRCLQHGAISLGGELSVASNLEPAPATPSWAFFLRSKVIAEFPKLRIEGYGDKKTDLEDRNNPLIPQVRKLADDLLFVYFDTPIQTVDIFLDPKNLFFGFTENSGVLSKDLKKTDGSETGTALEVADTDWRAKDLRVLNMKAWAQKMQTTLIAQTGDPEFNSFTSADFALQMVEGAPRVRFVVGEM